MFYRKRLGVTAAGLFGVLLLSSAGAEETGKYTIVNNLKYDLKFAEVQNTENIHQVSAAQSVPSCGSATTTFKYGTNGQNQHLKVLYNIENKGETISIVFKDTSSADCSIEHPDWVNSKTEHCGSKNSDKPWEYVVSESDSSC